jgi:putative peptidoglycan lipid II flippase
VAVALNPSDEQARPLPARPPAVRAAEVLTVLPALRDLPPGLVLELSPVLGPPPAEASEQSQEGPTADDVPRSSSRNATIMAAGTTLSRVSGFARILAVAWVLGQARLADAYNLANTVPNTIYDLLLGGVLSATLLPVLMEALTRRRADKDDDTVPAVVSFLTLMLLATTGIFWLAAPEIIRFFLLRATGSEVPGYRDLATTWLRYFTPQLFFIGLTTISTALLNARRRFVAVAFSPVLANLVTIAALVIADHLVKHPSVNAYRADSTAIAVVGIGTTAGYVVQLLAQLPALVRARIPLRPIWRPRHPALSKIGRLSSWTIGAVIANQVSFVLVSVLANSRTGNVSAFIYAYTFMQLPYAVVAVSIAYAVAPDLAELWALGDRDGFASRVSYAMRVTLVLLLPGGVGYALLAHPAMVLALAHGHLAASPAGLTGSTLSVFALGLPGFSAYLLLMRAFQSKQDTRSMFWIYLGENALTVVAALALYPALGVRGLAAAWIGPYTLALPFAWHRLRKSAPIVSSPSWLAYVAVSAGFMAAGVAALLQVLPTDRSVVLSALRLVFVTGVGAALFGLAARFLGISELRLLSNRYRSLLR